MMYEKDKLNIPEEYKKMSVSELRYEREKFYKQLRKDGSDTIRKTESKRETVKFLF